MNDLQAPQAHIELTGALRTAIEAARRADAPADVLDEARRLVLEAAALLGGEHRYTGPIMQGALREMKRTLFEADVNDPVNYFPYSPIVGPHNAIAPPVRMRLDGKVMRGEVTLPAQYVGPPGMVHGGVIALIFDELLGAANVSMGYGGYTGTLSVRYVNKTPIEEPLTMLAWVDRVERRKVFTVGELRHGDTVTATAEGIFIVGVGI